MAPGGTDQMGARMDARTRQWRKTRMRRERRRTKMRQRRDDGAWRHRSDGGTNGRANAPVTENTNAARVQTQDKGGNNVEMMARGGADQMRARTDARTRQWRRTRIRRERRRTKVKQRRGDRAWRRRSDGGTNALIGANRARTGMRTQARGADKKHRWAQSGVEVSAIRDRKQEGWRATAI